MAVIAVYGIPLVLHSSLKPASLSFHITIIINVSLISSHFICYAAHYCSIVSENKPPSSFHSCLFGFYRHSKSPHSPSILSPLSLSHFISYFVSLSFHSERKSFYRHAWRGRSGMHLSLHKKSAKSENTSMFVLLVECSNQSQKHREMFL